MSAKREFGVFGCALMDGRLTRTYIRIRISHATYLYEINSHQGIRREARASLLALALALSLRREAGERPCYAVRVPVCAGCAGCVG